MAQKPSVGSAVVILIVVYILYRLLKKKKVKVSEPIPDNPAKSKATSSQVISTDRPITKPTTMINSLANVQLLENAPTTKNHNFNDFSINMSDDPTPTSKAEIADEFWVPAGKEVVIQGISIKGGLFYCSNTNDIRWEYQKVVLQSSLEIEQTDAEQLWYINPYEYLTPSQRFQYLQWLSTGRKDRIEQPYLELFLMGLENRVIRDTLYSETARKEIPTIVAEIERLRNVYQAAERSFYNKASTLLAYIKRKFLGESPELIITENSSYVQEYPLDLKVTLAKLCLARTPVPAHIALYWAVRTEGFNYRWAYERCKDDFLKLFSKWYYMKFGNGIVLEENKKKISYTYQPLNYSLQHEARENLQYDDDTLPDVTYQRRVINKLLTFDYQGIEELGQYASFLERKPDEANTFRAYAKYPVELFEDNNNSYLAGMRQWISSNAPENMCTPIPLDGLLKQIGVDKLEKLNKYDTTAVIHFLSKFQVGIEPDIRFSAYKLSDCNTVVLYRLGINAENAPTENFSFAILFLHIAVAVSGADGAVADYEKTHLAEWINKSSEFTLTEKNRLLAHLQWLLGDIPKLSNMKKKFEILSDPQKEAFISHLIAVVAVDGRVDPDEIKLLEKVYGWMGKDTKTLFADIHSFQSGTSELPVTIMKGAKTGQDFAIPKPEELAVTGVVLNQTKVQQKLKDTAMVSGLLANVFAEQEELPQVKPTEQTRTSETVEGLDDLHSTLVRALIKQPSWTREEYEGLCQNIGLFPDGAMESINTLAYDRANEPLLEDDDPIFVNQTILPILIQQ